MNDNILLNYFNSHKEGLGIWKWQHYFDAYHKHLSKFIGKNINIIEVGVYSGGSLEMWRSYFGSGCNVCGIDIQPECKMFENEYTKIFIGDQEDREFWKRIKSEVSSYDILIDDGGHQTNQQIVTFEEGFSNLSYGGVYICEDIHNNKEINNSFTTYLTNIVNQLNVLNVTSIGVATTTLQQQIKSISFYPYVAIIEKVETPEQVFVAPKKGSIWKSWC